MLGPVLENGFFCFVRIESCAYHSTPPVPQPLHLKPIFSYKYLLLFYPIAEHEAPALNLSQSALCAFSFSLLSVGSLRVCSFVPFLFFFVLLSRRVLCIALPHCCWLLRQFFSQSVLVSFVWFVRRCVSPIQSHRTPSLFLGTHRDCCYLTQSSPVRCALVLIHTRSRFCPPKNAK